MPLPSQPPSELSPASDSPRGRRPAAPWLFLGVGLAGLIAVLAASGSAAFGTGTTAADRWIRAAVIGRHSPAMDAVATAISRAAMPTYTYAAAVVLAALVWWRRGWRAAMALLLAVALGVALERSSKALFARMRPPGGTLHATDSFPSGHTTAAAAVCVTAAFVLWRERLLSPFATVLVGAVVPIVVAWSRLRTDQHWATDVVAGWCLGLVIAGVCGLLHRRLVPRRTRG